MKIGNIEAQYVTHMGDDLLVVNAARQSFSKQKDAYDEKDASLINFLATGMRSKEWDAFVEELRVMFVEQDASTESVKQRLLQYKRQAVHFAPFAHPHATIRMRLPIFLARQFVKHQIGGTWSEESRRYMSSEIDYYFEEQLHGRPKDIKQGSADNVHPQSQHHLDGMNIMTDACNRFYEVMISDGIAPEEARQVVTLNAMTGVTWTGSLLFWSRVVTQRVDPHAQKAAQKLGRQIDAIMRPLYPESWQALVGNLPE